MSEKRCPSCGAAIDSDAAECKYCGEQIIVQAPQAPQAPQYQPPQAPVYTQQMPPQFNPATGNVSNKNKTVAGLLAIFLGGLGAHKFYLGKPIAGILYLVFCWTYIPEIVALIEGIIYLTSSDENFYMKYVRK